ncbi:hypothetical protein K431DRAFT_284407 [Polychaeton citri CBS 116435]|uniref:F-box domain-containing protein n=1 Tax=Polychaeton citri CBS 116435 TaxID=1314669 RepID=A0A9P4UQM5_9PEZI|nr:hypothetical protein K431DRAFT_284407 [Polychaeton citri CBS 116435]
MELDSTMSPDDTIMVDVVAPDNTAMSFNDRFPAEIREQIFLMSVLSLPSPTMPSPSSPNFLFTLPQEPAFTRVSRSWRAESLPLYYKHHHYSVLAPLRLSGYGELYNPKAEAERSHMLPSAEALSKVKKLRVEFLVDRFARGGDVRFRIDIDQIDGFSRRERRSQSSSVKSRAGWMVRNAGVDARNTYDPGEWREKAGMLVRYLETVLDEEFGTWQGIEGKWGEEGRGGKGNIMTRDILSRFLCVDLREQSDGAGHPLWIW